MANKADVLQKSRLRRLSSWNKGMSEHDFFTMLLIWNIIVTCIFLPLALLMLKRIIQESSKMYIDLFKLAQCSTVCFSMSIH
jgi:hypothetical protein